MLRVKKSLERGVEKRRAISKGIREKENSFFFVSNVRVHSGGFVLHH